MIIDKIENACFYYGLGDRIERGLKYLEKTDLSEVENGKYEIEGENLFFSVQDYQSKPLVEAKFEAHKKYIDIQFIIKGQERLGYGNIEDFSPVGGYDEEKDIVFLKGEGDFALGKEGYFLIFTPQDAHMPSVCIDEPQYVKKAVVKVLAN